MPVIKAVALEHFRDVGPSMHVIKRYSKAKLKKLLAASGTPPEYTTPLRRHQLAMLYTFLCLNGHAMWLADMGTGKTLTALTLINWMRTLGHGPALVTVPNATNVWSWKDQCDEHWPSLKYATLDDEARFEEKYHRFWHADVDLVIATLAGVRSVVGHERVPARKKKARKSKSKTQPIKQALQVTARRFDMGVFDEITSLKNHEGYYYRMIRDLSKNWRIRVGMTGQPIGRNPMPLWAQFYVLDRGRTFSKHIGVFRSAFFVQRKNDQGRIEWVFEKKRRKQLNRILRSGSIHYDRDECIDVPGSVHFTRKFKMSNEQAKRMIKIRDDAGNDPEKRSAAYWRCRQLASGIVVAADQRIKLKTNPRIDALIQFLEEIGPRQVVVYHQFIESGEMIVDRLHAFGRSPLALRKGKNAKRVGIERFNRKEVDTLVIQFQSGAMGLNLQHHCNHMVMFEPYPDPNLMSQATCRIDRMGQKKKCIVCQLIGVGTHDPRILKANAEGRDLHQDIVVGKEKL